MGDQVTLNDPFRERFILRNQRNDIEAAESLILAAIEGCAYDLSSCFGIRLALEEAISNAFKHGNEDDPAKSVQLDCVVTNERVVLAVQDEGSGFSPGAVPDPTQQENMEIPAGRGLMLMRAFMTNVNILPPGNRVEMIFLKSGAPSE